MCEEVKESVADGSRTNPTKIEREIMADEIPVTLEVYRYALNMLENICVMTRKMAMELFPPGTVVKYENTDVFGIVSTQSFYSGGFISVYLREGDIRSVEGDILCKPPVGEWPDWVKAIKAQWGREETEGICKYGRE